MFKIVYGASPLYLSQICQPTASSTRYATRSANNIRVPRCRTSYFKNSFFPPSIKYWNSLDYSIRNLDSLSLFKRRIKDKYGYNAHHLIIIQVYEQLPSGTLVCVSECHSYLLISFPSALLSLLDDLVA